MENVSARKITEHLKESITRSFILLPIQPKAIYSETIHNASREVFLKNLE